MYELGKFYSCIIAHKAALGRPQRTSDRDSGWTKIISYLLYRIKENLSKLKFCDIYIQIL